MLPTNDLAEKQSEGPNEWALSFWLTKGPSRQIWVFKEQQNEIEISKKKMKLSGGHSA
jgi:hypothetical protein